MLGSAEVLARGDDMAFWRAEIIEVRQYSHQTVVAQCRVIAGDELCVVVIEIEIERVAGIGIDGLELGLHHEQFAEAERSAVEVDVVGSGNRNRERRRGTERA